MQGTDQPVRRRAEPPFKLATSAPPPDVLVDPVAVAFWNEKSAELIEARVLKTPHLTMLAVAANLYAKMVQKWRVGAEPSSAEVAQFRMYMNEFGLSPASETKAPGTSGAVTNPFSQVAKA